MSSEECSDDYRMLGRRLGSLIIFESSSGFDHLSEKAQVMKP